MSPTQSHVDQTRLALAALTACIVRTLDATDPNVRTNFEKYLAKAYSSLGDSSVDNIGAMETLTWAKEILNDL